MIKCLRKLFIVVLLVTSFCRLSADVSLKGDWNTIWQNVNTIELNLQQLQTDNQKLQELLDTQALYLAKQSIQLQNYENSLKRWKMITIGSTVFALTMGAMYLIERNK